MDLQAYLKRIGYTNSVSPTLDVLHAIAYQHPTSIPFENLNPLLGLPVDVEVEDLEKKLIHGGRGGYCYEQNRLLLEALLRIGFQASGLAARVLFMRQDDTLPARSHMLLRVDLDGKMYIIDSGFGGATPTAPLQLVADVKQETPHEPYRILRDGDEWLVQVLKNDQWESMYMFDLQRQHPQDYTFANYFVSTHPASHFVNNLMAARPVSEGRYTLNNRQLSFHPKDGAPQRQILDDPSELRAALTTHFGLNLEDLPQLDARLAAFFSDDPS